MSIDPGLFRQAMSRFASGVTIVTTAHEGAPAGLTVSSFASLSLTPALVLVCIDRNAGSHEPLAKAEMFAVNILAEGQEHLSNRFARHDEERFQAGTYSLSSHGLPLISGALAQIECRRTDSLPGGDHTIFIGEVVTITFADGAPLVYYRSGYQRLEPRP